MMCACPRATYAIRNGSCQNLVEILCLWTQLSEFIKACRVMTAPSRCLTRSAVGGRQKLRGSLWPEQGPSPPALPSAPWGLWLSYSSLQGRAQQQKPLSASSVCACLGSASAWTGACLLHRTSSVWLCSISNSNWCLLGLGRHWVCTWIQAGGKEPGSPASTLLCNQSRSRIETCISNLLYSSWPGSM